MSKYVTLTMYFQKWERYNADGYFPEPGNLRFPEPLPQSNNNIREGFGEP